MQKSPTKQHRNASRTFYLLNILLAVGFLQACSFVEPMSGSESVIFISKAENCEKIGQASVSVLSEIMKIDRSEQAIADELTILAKNAAFKMEGNAIKPSSAVEQGSQNFDVFKCQ